MSVTFTASANATPASGIVIATCTVSSEEYQLIILAGQDGNTFGVGIASPLFTRLSDGTDSVLVNAASRLTTEASLIGGSINAASAVVTNIVSASIGSGSITVDKVDTVVSTSVAGGSVALLTGANTIGTASVIQSTPTGIANAWPVQLTDGTDTALVNAASRLTTEASILGGSINAASVIVTAQVSASVSGGSVALLTGANTIGVASVIQSTPTGIANAWPVKITDGTDSVVVTAASEALVFVNKDRK